LKNTLKILYIFLAGVGVFFINNLWVLLAVIGIHILLYFFIKSKKKSLRFLWKIKWFVLLIFLIHAFSGNNDIILYHFSNWDWSIALSYDGMYKGGVMAGKLLAMLTITQVVRLSMTSQEFVKGLSGVGMSISSAEIIDQIIGVVTEEKKGKGGGGDGSGSGGGKKSKEKEKKQNQEDTEIRAVDILTKGKVGNIPKKLVKRLQFAGENFKDSPNASIAASALAITLIRMVKIAPGLPLAPGHKSVLLFPVFIYGISNSEKRFAGVQIGSISGILHFSMGFGKFGPLGILEFSIVGLVIDLMLRLPFKKTNLFFLMLIGGTCGLVRITIEILLAYTLLPNSELSIAFILVYLPYIISQVSFGIASGFVSRALLKTQENE
jgi:hypothetical protein